MLTETGEKYSVCLSQTTKIKKTCKKLYFHLVFIHAAKASPQIENPVYNTELASQSGGFFSTFFCAICCFT